MGEGELGGGGISTYVLLLLVRQHKYRKVPLTSPKSKSFSKIRRDTKWNKIANFMSSFISAVFWHHNHHPPNLDDRATCSPLLITINMLAYPLALTALLAGSATAVSRTTKQEFIRTMSSQKNLDRKLMADVAKTSRSLTKSIKQNAIMVPPGRKLEDAANANQNQYNQNQYNQQQNQNQKYYSANYMSGTDDAFANADWENSWGFDASQYSLSYERCATVKHFDLDKAAQEDATSPFRTQHFAVLRLCPTRTCDTPDWYLQDDAGAEAEYEAEAEEEQQQEEQTETYGANGRGCQSNYATFLLDAGEYLEIMADYEDTQFEMYCGYCAHYMQSQYNKWVSNGGHRDLEFEEFKNDPHRMLGNEWNSCAVYAKACNGGFADDYSDYLNCAEVQKDNGMVAYTQATCAEDGETITIGLYSDEYCSEDITSSSNIANWIGEYVDDEEMAHYYKKVNAGLGELIASYGGQTNVNPNSVCMPCAAEVSLLRLRYHSLHPFSTRF